MILKDVFCTFATLAVIHILLSNAVRLLWIYTYATVQPKHNLPHFTTLLYPNSCLCYVLVAWHLECTFKD